MGYYENVYLKRLNRYGIDFQSRMQGQREENGDPLPGVRLQADDLQHDQREGYQQGTREHEGRGLGRQTDLDLQGYDQRVWSDDRMSPGPGICSQDRVGDLRGLR